VEGKEREGHGRTGREGKREEGRERVRDKEGGIEREGERVGEGWREGYFWVGGIVHNRRKISVREFKKCMTEKLNIVR